MPLLDDKLERKTFSYFLLPSFFSEVFAAILVIRYYTIVS